MVTPRFNLDTYQQGDTDWSHSDTVEFVDEYGIDRGTLANRPSSGTYDDELYYAEDQGLLYQWDSGTSSWGTASFGSQSNPVPDTSYFDGLDANEVSTETSRTESKPFIDPTHPQYGATPGDTSDDAPAIQAALNEAQNQVNPAKVILPGGSYYLDSQITIPYRVTLEGANQFHTELKYRGNDNVAISVRDGEVYLRDFHLSDGGGNGTHGIATDGGGYEHIDMENVLVSGFSSGRGIWLNESYNQTLFNVIATDCDKGFYEDSNGFGRDLIHCEADSCTIGYETAPGGMLGTSIWMGDYHQCDVGIKTDVMEASKIVGTSHELNTTYDIEVGGMKGGYIAPTLSKAPTGIKIAGGPGSVMLNGRYENADYAYQFGESGDAAGGITLFGDFFQRGSGSKFNVVNIGNVYQYEATGGSAL